MTVFLYAGILSLIIVWLTLHVIKTRGKHKTALGDANIDELSQAIRAHANCIEYTPIFLVLLFFIETTNISQWLVHGLGLLFTTGRVCHAYSLLKVEHYKNSMLTTHVRYRRYGMMCTIWSLITSALIILIYYSYNSFFK